MLILESTMLKTFCQIYKPIITLLPRLCITTRPISTKLKEPIEHPKLTRMDHERNRKNKITRIEYGVFISESQSELRTDLRIKGVVATDEIWQKRVEDKEFLKKYSNYMYKLATEHWHYNNMNSRLSWIYDHIKDYYFNGKMENKTEKEQRIVQFLLPEYLDQFQLAKEKQKLSSPTKDTPIKVLDVGSCYNPFSIYEDLDVTAIDLCPAVPEVMECDFLKIKVIYSDEDIPIIAGKRKREDSSYCHETSDKKSKMELNMNKEMEENKDAIPFVPEILEELPAEYFDVIIFSLVICYIPSPHLRYLCFKKAYELLKPNGIICIVTPDSKSINSNVHVINLWRVTLGFLGFQRVDYEKCDHFHSLVYRKGLCKDVWPSEAKNILNKLKTRSKRPKFKDLNYDSVHNNIFIVGDFNKHLLEIDESKTVFGSLKAKFVRSISAIKEKLFSSAS